MWNALRSDLKEFVSTVTEDTSEVLSKIDESFPALSKNDPSTKNDCGKEACATLEEEEAMRRMELEETFTFPLLLDGDDDDDDDVHRAEVELFTKSFELSAEFEQDLEIYPKLHAMYRNLVPEKLSKKDFWMRYSYRCDVNRITDEWNAQDKRTAARPAAISQGISSVKQFFGDAVMSIANSLKEGDFHDSSGGDNDGAGISGPITTGFFSAGGIRPPFVLNTAVDENDDEAGEEELGWGDDDDEEEEEEKQEGEGEELLDTTQEEIEFRDAATEHLQEQLKLAIDERDQLHETVSMQAKEIADLIAIRGKGDESGHGETVIMEDLKLKLFETESELAMVKERLLSSTPYAEPPTSNALISTEASLIDDKLTQQVDSLNCQLRQSEAVQSDLQNMISELELAISNLSNEKKVLETLVSSLQSSSDVLHKQKIQLEEEVAVITSQQKQILHVLESELDTAKQRIMELEEVLNKSSDRMVSTPSPETHQSSDSGVKVDAVLSMNHVETHALGASPHLTASAVSPPVIDRSCGSEEGEEGSDWGDEW